MGEDSIVIEVTGSTGHLKCCRNQRFGEISRGGALGKSSYPVIVKSVHLLIEAVACGDEETL